MSTDITPKDLVKLAKYCGYIARIHEDNVFIYVGRDRKKFEDFIAKGVESMFQFRLDDWILWQPHLPEGAVQLMELVEALARAGYAVAINTLPAQTKHGIWIICSVHHDGSVIGQSEHTIHGEALCWAMLQVIR